MGKITVVPPSPTPPPHFQVQHDSQTTPFTASTDQTVLLSALAAGHELLSSCRNGVCRTCICRLHTGRVTYRMDWPGLSAEEKADGWFLPCVAYPASDLVMGP